MSPELRDSLERIAMWHQLQGTATHAPSWHHTAAADIRAAIVSADDATKKMLILRAHKAQDRRFSGEAITGFDQLRAMDEEDAADGYEIDGMSS